MTLGADNRIKELFQKYVDKTITEEEYAEFFVYIRNPETKDEVLAFLDDYNKKVQTDALVHEVDWDSMLANITGSTKIEQNKKLFFWKYAAAAILLLVGGTFVYSLFSKDEMKKTPLVYHNDVNPAQNIATLTLSDGAKIVLDDNIVGKLALQDNISIERDAAGQIVYRVIDVDLTDDRSSQTQKLNTLATPAGGTFSVVLSDGSKVWLNASSSIEFPAAFANDSRSVRINGEAYFEIAKDARRPFYVVNRGAEVKVLGTHFNVKSYPDEYRSEVTLLEGSVKFTKDGRSQLLKPGKQITYKENSSEAEQDDANLEQVMAWRNQLFVFDNTNIDEIMTELKRWYGVSVNYEGEKPDISFTGVIPRNANISKVLEALELTGDVTFGIEGKVITCEKMLKK